MLQQPSLAFQTPTVAGEGSVRPDDAMTGHDDPDGIRAIRETYGSHSLGAADLLGEFSVGNGGAAGDLPQFLPDAALKGRASRLYGYRVYGFDVTRKVTVDCIPETMRIVGRFEVESIFP